MNRHSAVQLMVTIAIVAASSSVCAQEITVGLGGSFPYTQQTSYDSGNTKKVQGAGGSFSLRSSPAGDGPGFFSNFDFYVPGTIIFSNGTDSETVHLSDYDSYWGCSVLAGGFGYVLRSYPWGVPFGFGVHGHVESSEAAGVTTVSSGAGLGAWISFEAAVSRHFSLFAGTDVVFDFWGYSSTQVNSGRTDSDHDTWRLLGVVPRAGVLFHP